MSARQYRSTVEAKTLNQAITNVSSSIVLNSVTTLPSSYPYTLVIDPDTLTEEIVTVTSSAGGNSLNVTRGQDGTTAQAHNLAAAVRHMITARDLQEPQDHINNGGYHVIVCTSTTRPASPVDGQHIYETDTDKTLSWDGTNWNPVSGAAAYQASAPANPSVGSLWVDSDETASQLNTNDFLLKSDATATYTPLSGERSGFRNAIINGNFAINQRGFTSTSTSGAYGFDRWSLATGSNGTCTYSSLAFVPGNAIPGYEPTNYARLVTAGQTLSSAYSIFEQKIEDVRTFAGQTVTVSFWARAASGTPKLSIENIQYFGIGGSPSANTFTYGGQVTLSTSFARYSVTYTVPSVSGKTIGTTANTSFTTATFWTSGGSDYNARTGSLGIQNNTIDIWGVQVERGSVATPFEQRPIGTELALCQRYYWRQGGDSVYQTIGNGSGWAIGTSHVQTRIQNPVSMRIVPTSIEHANLIWSDGVNASVGTGTLSVIPSQSSKDVVFVNGPTAAGTVTVFRNYDLLTNNTLSGYLALVAEL